MTGSRLFRKVLCFVGLLSHKVLTLKRAEFPVSVHRLGGEKASMVLRFTEGDSVKHVIEEFWGEHHIADDISHVVAQIQRFHDGRKDLHPLSLRFGTDAVPSAFAYSWGASEKDAGEVCSPLSSFCKWGSSEYVVGIGGGADEKERQRVPHIPLDNVGSPAFQHPKHSPHPASPSFRDALLSGPLAKGHWLLNGAAQQDVFAIWAHYHRISDLSKRETPGFYVELGAYHPRFASNCFALENGLGWRGVLVDIKDTYVDLYRSLRPRARAVIADAVNVDYPKLLKEMEAPKDIDFLQIDLDEENGSTLGALELFDRFVFPLGYRFAAVAFEHEVFLSNAHDTRNRARAIFARHGYMLALSDVATHHEGQFGAFEDWFVHPALVKKEKVDELIALNQVRRKADRSVPGATVIDHEHVLFPL